jgi:cell division protease FtsH
MAHIEEAIDRVLAGLERKSRLISPREKAIVAVHETGHAMAASLLPHADPVHRVSVIPRGVAAAGMTLQLQREERNVLSRAELYDRIAVLLGGGVAEQVVFDDVSTGAANDLQKVTDLAYRMVVDFGMSERLGPVSLAGPDSPPFMPAGGQPGRVMSDDTKREVDLEVRRIVEEQEKRVLELLTEHKRRLVAIARVLREKETLDAENFEGLMQAPFRQGEPAEAPATDPA